MHPASLPLCQRCHSGVLRPAVCWFGETLPQHACLQIDKWFDLVPRVDLVLVLGTERTPYVQEAMAMGAEVAYFNFFENGLEDTADAWYVDGDLSQSLPLVVMLSGC